MKGREEGYAGVAAIHALLMVHKCLWLEILDLRVNRRRSVHIARTVSTDGWHIVGRTLVWLFHLYRCSSSIRSRLVYYRNTSRKRVQSLGVDKVQSFPTRIQFPVTCIQIRLRDIQIASTHFTEDQNKLLVNGIHGEEN